MDDAARDGLASTMSDAGADAGASVGAASVLGGTRASCQPAFSTACAFDNGAGSGGFWSRVGLRSPVTAPGKSPCAFGAGALLSTAVCGAVASSEKAESLRQISSSLFGGGASAGVAGDRDVEAGEASAVCASAALKSASGSSSCAAEGVFRAMKAESPAVSCGIKPERSSRFPLHASGDAVQRGVGVRHAAFRPRKSQIDRIGGAGRRAEKRASGARKMRADTKPTAS